LLVEVGFGGGIAAQGDGFIGELAVQRAAIRFGIHCNRAQIHAPGRTDNTAGNLSAIGDQQRSDAHEASSPSGISSLGTSSPGTQGAGCLSKNACRPAWASAPVRTREIISQVYCVITLLSATPSSSRIRVLAVAIACGPLCSSRSAIARAESISASAGTHWCTRRASWAAAASKTSAVRK